MKLVVCIKQVPDTTDVKIDPKNNTLIREGVPSIVNPFDLFAIEEALRLREHAGGTVTLVTMGPPQASSALSEGIAMGADDAILLTDRVFAGADTLATSYTLAAALRRLGQFDLVLCGKQAIDGDTAQVGPGIAEWLDIPHVAFVRKIRQVDEAAQKMVVETITEDGYEVIETTLPCLLTVVKEINEPRIPSLRGRLRAKQTPILTWRKGDFAIDERFIGYDGSPTWVVKMFTPSVKKAGEVWQGAVDEGVARCAVRIKALGVD